MSKCAISMRPAGPVAASTIRSRSADVPAATTSRANADMSGWPTAAASFARTASNDCLEITVARSPATRRMAIRSIVLTTHLQRLRCLNDRRVQEVAKESATEGAEVHLLGHDAFESVLP